MSDLPPLPEPESLVGGFGGSTIKYSEHVRLMRSYALAAVEAEREWRPIATAPKDGTAVLVFAPSLPLHSAMHWPSPDNDDRQVTIAAWAKKDIGTKAGWRSLETTTEFSYGDTDSFEYAEAQFVEPTHWKPLPPPPAAIRKQER